MIETPHITQSLAQKVATIPLTVPRSEIQTVMGPAICEIYAALQAQGIAPAGPWFTYHAQAPSYLFDFKACVPVATTVASDGRVRADEVPAETRVARTIYHGPYEGLAEAWGELRTWVNANGHRSAEHLWERYLVGPETSPNPADWRTELNQPLI